MNFHQTKFRSIHLALLTVLILFSVDCAFPCSMYKITVNGKTMVGCNEDAWRLTPRIWFETGTKTGPYGAAFTGSRIDGNVGFAPQSGMNEFGLAFSRLASYTPESNLPLTENKKIITDPTLYLKDILHRCKTVEEVKEYISEYEHSYFIEDVFIYIDKSGDYLVVEPYLMTFGNEPKYVLSNFCPSATTESDALKLDRYRKGIEFLKNRIDTALGFCTALSDTMHVCRGKIGDGTLLTSIWDLKNGIINLYFYHNYNDLVQFHLDDELAKGDHILEIQALFSPNSEFKKLASYKIPQNSLPIMLFLIFSGGLFLFSALFFLVSYLRKRDSGNYSYIKPVLVLSGIILFYYMYVLARNINIFYFATPYKDYQSFLVSLASYIPFSILLIIIPSFILSIRIYKEKAWGSFAGSLFILNNAVCLILTGFFIYWGLLNPAG